MGAGGSGSAVRAEGGSSGKPENPLVERPSWRMRLAYFLPDPGVEEPDYEETIRLLDNGVVQDMLLDYGDYVVHAKLDEIIALPKPGC